MPPQHRTSRTARLAVGAVSAALLATTAVLGVDRPAAARPADTANVPTIAWASCGPEAPQFECAEVEVPLDYDKPLGTTTTIAVTRLPATDQSTKIGTVFTNPGGPGGSGVDFVQSVALAVVPAEVRARFDILGFDPRGVARSDPATCYASAAEEAAAAAGTVLFPLTRAEERRFDREQAALARSCAATSPSRFRHMSSANVARDMDLLRRAVGDRQLTYAGYSYGTFLGATYAKLFPHRIRAMVLDGTIDPREYVGTADRFRRTPVGVRIEQDRGGSEVFGEFLRQCKLAGPQRCSLAALGDPATVARTTLDRLKKKPVEVVLPDGSSIEITYQIAVVSSFQSLYSPVQWVGLADLYAVLAVESGAVRPAGLADRSVAASSRLGADAAAAVRRGEDYASLGGALSTCVDTRTPDPRVYPVVADRQDRRFPDFGRFRTWVDLTCHYLKREGIRDRDAYTGPWRQTTRAHVLVLGTRWDPATPYRNTRPYADLFPDASMVTLEGWGHVTLAQSRCADTRVWSYLLDPRGSRGDQRCVSDLKPFTQTPGSTTGAQQAQLRALVDAAGS